MAKRKRRLMLVALMALLPWPVATGVRMLTGNRFSTNPSAKPGDEIEIDGMIRIEGGAFPMGNVRPAPDDQRPLHRVRLDTFWIDQTLVTNRQFAEFVTATGHITSAEQRGTSLAFDTRVGGWREIAQADWRHPRGPNSSIAGRDDHPVVHVSWHDAAAYAAWAGKQLPTEAQAEYTARGGLADRPYPWGKELVPSTGYQANFWQGWFPQADRGDDGFRGTSPVRQFPANPWELYDMAGNVWCWCADWYDGGYYARSPAENPSGPRQGTQRVRRGGCWLSSSNYGGGLRIGYRDHALPGESTNHTGFRCVRSE